MPKAPVFVVLVDFAPEMEATVSAVVALAKRCGADVHILTIVSRRGPSLLDHGIEIPPGSGITAKRDWSRLDAPIHAAERGGTNVRTIAYRGDATKVVASYAQLTKARLLVIDQHYGSPRWRRTTRIVSTISRGAPAPVLVVPPRRPAEKNKSLTFLHIVSAVDLTVASAVAVRTVLDLIRRTGARLTLVHALTNAPNHTVFSGGEAVRVTRNLQMRASNLAKHLQRKVQAKTHIRVDARVTTGEPHHGILEIASEVKADLIVMAVPPRSRFDEVLFGSTLRNVVRRATIPVLVLPVTAGAYRRLEDTDRVDIPVTPKTAARVKRLTR
jgi:nucleotide-binding universal stress UspA family protein